MKLIGIAFNQVLAVSKASEVDLLGYWKWLQLKIYLRLEPCNGAQTTTACNVTSLNTLLADRYSYSR